MNNRFFTTDDIKQDKLIYDLEPQFFWSRKAEYFWVLDKVKQGQICLDAACGTYHPFKFALTDKCKVYACDIEDLSYENINKETINRFGIELDKELYDKVKFNQCNITSLPYSDKMFSVITCISAIEHMDEQTILEGLKEFKRILKDDGKIVITLDYPTLKPDEFIELVKQVGLIIDGGYNYDLPDNAIFSDYFGDRLYCYSIVLKQPEQKKTKQYGKLKSK